MIITCEKCDTRFNLDDSRIPADGVKVRCSRCKHAFFVVPGEVSDADAAEDLAHRAAAEAAAQGQTQTLEDTDDRTEMLERGSVDFSARARDEAEEESDWEFNEDPEALGAAAATPERVAPEPVPDLADELLGGDLGDEPLAPAAPEAPAAPAAPERPLQSESPEPATASDPMKEFLDSESPASEADSLSLDDLGSPEEWDLLGSKDSHDGAAVEPPPTPAEPATEAAPAAAEEAEESDDAVQFEAPPAAVVEELPFASSSPRVVSTGLGAVAWAVTAVLLALAAWGSLVPPAAAPGFTGPTRLGQLQVDGVEAQVVENAVAGPLYVVRGKLHNPGRQASLPGARLQVQLLDGSGAALAVPPAPLAAAPSEASLRLDKPEALLARQRDDADALARTELAPGESIAVAALLPRLPEDARGFRLELGRPVSSPEASPAPPRPVPGPPSDHHAE